MSEKVVTAKYLYGSPQDYVIDVTDREFHYRRADDAKWVSLPWNVLFAYLDAALMTEKPTPTRRRRRA